MFAIETVVDVPVLVTRVEAHSGRTDSNGGHKDNKNKSGLGSYHYHCGGYPAHLHTDGTCPYAASNTETAALTSSSGEISASTASAETTSGTAGSTKKSKASKSDIKKVQEALNILGYDCGKPDGICGSTTKKRIKEFQNAIGITADGVVDQELMDALGV